MTISIVFSLKVWNKIRFLSPKERSRLLSKIRVITSDNVANNQIKKIGKDHNRVIFRIRYNLNYRIIATLIKDNAEEKIIKIVDFIPHSKLDQRIYYIEGLGDLTIEDVENLDNETLAEEHIWKDNFWNINQIENSYFYQKDDDFFSFTINPENQTDPDLILSSQQYQIITKNPNLPTLLTGSAGSGKTSIALYLALHNAHIQKDKESLYQVLYVTYNRSLTNYAENIIKRIYPEKLDNFINIDYHNLCKIFSEKYRLNFERFKPENKINLYRFIQNFYQTRTKKIRHLNPVSLWEEIRHLLKGSLESINSENHLISYGEYKKLTKQSVLSPDINYQEVYQLVTDYQNWLESREYWDELDYTHYLLKQIPEDYQGEYHEIYCDEIQDLTQIQVKFLLKLLILNNDGYSLPKIFFTGDPAQIINPSGFSWNKIKTNIYQSYKNYYQIDKIKEKIEPKHLTINFRSYSGIVNLGSAIVNIIRENSNNQSELIRQETWLESETKPFILKQNPEQIFEEKAKFGVKNAIIVSDENEREKLALYFPQDSERILTIQEVKGLEFDEVLIWNFFTGFDSWQNHHNQAIRELNSFKYNCLYVAITRARNRLYFYENQTTDFWNKPEVKDLVTQDSLIDLETIFDSFFASYNNIEEMRESAEEYVNQINEKGYKIAIQIYQRIGDEREVNRVKALLAEFQENWEDAGEYWDKIDEIENVLLCWDKVNANLWQKKWQDLTEDKWDLRGSYFEGKNNYDMAIYCYQQSHNIEKEINCLENLHQYELAGDKLREIKRKKDAFYYYELADENYRENKRLDKSAQMWTKLEIWDKASPLWESLQEWEKAGECWQKAKQFELSALCWEKVEAWDKAEKCWQELGKWEKVAICCQNQGKWRLGAENWLKINEKNKSAYCYQQANDLDKAMELWIELESWHQVAIALELEQRYSEAAKIWAKVNPLQQKALCHEKCEEWEEAEKCWRELGNWHQVALMCEKQDKWLEAIKIWRKLRKTDLESKAIERIREIKKTAQYYERIENWQEAEKYWRIVDNKLKIAICLYKQAKNWQEIAEIYQSLQQWESAGKAWQKINEWEKAAECYEKGSCWQLAEDCWRGLNNTKKLAYCLGKQGKWYEAGEECLKIDDIQKALICYKKINHLSKMEECYRKLEEWENVANVCEKQEKWTEAAKIWIKMPQYEKAGECYEKSHQWEYAKECWKHIGNDKRALYCLEKSIDNLK